MDGGLGVEVDGGVDGCVNRWMRGWGNEWCSDGPEDGRGMCEMDGWMGRKKYGYVGEQRNRRVGGWRVEGDGWY